MTEQRPDWLQEPCPTWCLGDHHDADHPLDRAHQGTMLGVAVVALDRHLDPQDGSWHRAAFSTECLVVMFQYLDDAEVWVVAEGEHGQRLEVSKESAQRLYYALGKVLAASEIADGIQR
jgi:hypothetical protein